MANDPHAFYAYEIYGPDEMSISRAPLQRDWMEAAGRGPYRCLPLVMANQSGWLLHCPATVYAHWNGGPSLSDLWLGTSDPFAQQALTFSVYASAGQAGPGGAVHASIKSHFGHGILTFCLPFLFRTPPGINLWVKGPSNWIKDGICPLEGVVEADWAPSTFTMNWKLTRPGLTVRFDKGEPMCMLVPVPRGLAESLEPRQTALQSNPEMHQAYLAWETRRNQSLHDLETRRSSGTTWEKDYFLGRTPFGSTFEGHQTNLDLKEFKRETPTLPAPGGTT